MNKKNILYTTTLVLLILTIITTQETHTYNMVSGIIQFPKSTEKVPMIRIYTCGKKVLYQSCNLDHATGQFTYFVPLNNINTVVNVVITEKINFEANKDAANTINYLKVDEQNSYKFYRLLLTTRNDIGTWEIQETQLNKNRQIPDDAIIICYDPTCISSLTGGNTFELPTITLKSCPKNTDTSTELLLASIDSDTLHATPTLLTHTNKGNGTSFTTTIITT